jgi:hypothetical protein
MTAETHDHLDTSENMAPDRAKVPYRARTVTMRARELRVMGAGMLAVAAVRPLIPIETGPPCPLRLITGIPCPLCGMTRGVTAVVHGDFAYALLMNPAAYLAVAVALLLIVQWRVKQFVIPLWIITGVLGVMWIWQIYKFATGKPL